MIQIIYQIVHQPNVVTYVSIRNETQFYHHLFMLARLFLILSARQEDPILYITFKREMGLQFLLYSLGLSP